MKILEDRIRAEGIILPGHLLNVGSFLNQQLDVELYNEIGQEFYRRFEGEGISKILTIEASGIGIACISAQYFHCPVVLARKFRGKNLSDEVYSTEVVSYTHGLTYTVTIPKRFISSSDSVLIIDDLLANGCALEGLINLTEIAGAALVGAGVVIEKSFQEGGSRIRGRGIRLESLAVISRMDQEEGIFFE